MGRTLTTINLVHTICRWRYQHSTRRSAHTDQPDMASLLEEKLNTELPKTINGATSIYRVPHRLHSVEPKAYEPNIVSIGPYHHGAHHLQAMESTKWTFFHHLFNPTNPNRPNLTTMVTQLKEMEHKARGCYSEDLKLTSKQFVSMLLIDSCFVIQLLKETSKADYNHKSTLIKRWMLPVLQRDLIMLENQLPLFVLNELYDLISSVGLHGKPTKEEMGLKDLALRFFEPLIYKDGKKGGLGDEEVDGNHFLELFRATIFPTDFLQDKEICGKEPHMFRSITELKKSGIKVKKAEGCQPLDVIFETNGVLKIAPMSMDDYKFTLFRNMVAFEQCHFAARPHVTAYIFFLDRLINSAEDVELLHYAGVMQHSLGGNKHAARLVNMLCKEVAGAVDDSYLHHVLGMINRYCNSYWNQMMAKLKRGYFKNIWVSLSTLAAILLVYLTVLQTVWELGDEKARVYMFEKGFWRSVREAILVPFVGIKSSKLADQIDGEQPMDEKADRLQTNSLINITDDDIKPFFFMSC